MISLNKKLIPLALGTFGLGMSEFVMMGILPDIAKSMNVSIPTAGQFYICLCNRSDFRGNIDGIFVKKSAFKKIVIGFNYCLYRRKPFVSSSIKLFYDECCKIYRRNSSRFVLWNRSGCNKANGGKRS